jgi:arginine/lysine/ornithine decarboxylase
MSDSTYPVYQILAKLDAAKIYYTLDKTRDETVMILAQVPGRHYEIEIFADGQIEVEIYKSSGEIGGQELVDELLRDFSD